MHGPMLGRMVETLGLEPAIEDTVWESLALANTLTAFATTRRYAWHSVGALGVVELTAPTRVAKVGEGLKRLGFPPVARKIFRSARRAGCEACRRLDSERAEAARQRPSRDPNLHSRGRLDAVDQRSALL
jgi:hypothetical protein